MKTRMNVAGCARTLAGEGAKYGGTGAKKLASH